MGSKGPYDWPLHHGTARATRSAVFENPSGYDDPRVIGIGRLVGGRPVADRRTLIPVRPRRSPRFDRESATVWTDVILYVVRRLAAQTDVRTLSFRRLRPLSGSQSREREKAVDRRCPIHTVPYDGSDLKMWALVLHGARRDVVAPSRRSVSTRSIVATTHSGSPSSFTGLHARVRPAAYAAATAARGTAVSISPRAVPRCRRSRSGRRGDSTRRSPDRSNPGTRRSGR